MNRLFLEEQKEKTNQTIIDINLNLSHRKNYRKSMFEMFSNNNNVYNTNLYPKDIYNANNKINLILSKNLKSIYNENKGEISNDNSLYENVNVLIKRNHNSIKQLLEYTHNYENNNSTNNFKNSNNNSFKKISQKNLHTTQSPRKKLLPKRVSLSQTSIRNNISFRKMFDYSTSNKPDFLFGSHNKQNKALKINKDLSNKNLFSINRKSKSNTNNKNKIYNIIESKRYIGTNTSIEKNKNKLNDILRGNSTDKKLHNFSMIQTPNNFNMYGKNKFNHHLNDSKSHILSALSANLNNHSNYRLNSKSNSKIKSSRQSVFTYPSRKNMKIPSLNQIHNDITKSFIQQNIKKIKQQLNDFDKNEVSEMFNKLPKNEPKKNYSLENINIIESIRSEQKKESLHNKSILNNNNFGNSNKNQISINEEERFQKKYRKIFLCKNIYDSLDDEEIVDEEKIHDYFISTNSFTVYLIDTFVLIATLIELIYLPLYLSLHISSYEIYYNMISSYVLYFADLIFIIDLITGFFRAYHNFDEILIKNNTFICLNYLTGWFIFDLFEAIPIFTLLDKNMKKYRNNIINSTKNVINLYDYGLNNKFFGLTFIKIFKVFKIIINNKSFKSIYKCLDKNKFLSDWKGFVATILITFSCLHFCTCFFIFMGKNEFPGWIVVNNFQNEKFKDIYVMALYYLITTLTTVGYGDITATNGFEKIYGIIALIVGTCAYSWILTYISNYIKKYNEKYIDFEDKMKILSDIKLNYPNMSKSLYDRIKRYLNYNKSESRCNLKFILESLPSSLQNNLIIEIYKPIIKNFQFFKSFENSDFFVKIVTSLKPILSMKDDILIQEGDIIEDIIFIKTGVLTLEIVIDLNQPKQSAETHLNMTGMECFKTIPYNKFKSLMSLNSAATNNQFEFSNQVLTNKHIKQKEIKIIDLRKNEHFGDILMILNEKSPLTVKVKSKKAELFFLQKTEATEISNRYPNIWKRIVNRSLHNMKQIKNLIRKKVLNFIETYNIEINPELKEKFYIDHYQNYFSNIESFKEATNHIETIIEEEESNINKRSSIEMNMNQAKNITKLTDNFENKYLKENKIQINPNKKEVDNKSIIKHKNITKDIQNKDNNKNNSRNINLTTCDNTSLYEKSEETHLLNNKKKSQSYIGDKKNEDINKINDVNNMISLIDKKMKKSSKKNQINNFNINIYTPKIQFPINQIQIENQSFNKYNNIEEKSDLNNSSNFERVNDEISSKNEFLREIIHNDVMMDNTDKNNNLIYSNLNCLKDKIKNNKKSSNIMKLFEKRKEEKIFNKKYKYEKTENKTNYNTDDKSISSDRSKVILKSNIGTHIVKNSNHFSNLNTSQSTSFTINSIYENINEISKFKYYKDKQLRESTKKFILNNISDKYISGLSLKKSETNNLNLLNLKNNMNNYYSKMVKKKSAEIETKKNVINKELDQMKSRITKMKSGDNIFSEKKILKKKETKSSRKDDLNSNNSKKNSLPFFSPVNCNKRKSLKLKPLKNLKLIDDDEQENNFYNKIYKNKTLKKKDGYSPEKKLEKDEKMNYEILISQNIESNQQNLNNPEVYYEGFFNDIIFKSKKSNNIFGENDIKKKKTFQK